MAQLWIGIGLFSTGVGMLIAGMELTKLRRKVENLERQLKEFDVIPETFIS